jgi:diguanylate cyclase (GGDEF)-like protein
VPAGPSTGSLRRIPWVALAALIVALGALGSVLGARTVSRDDAQRSRQSNVTTSVEISSTFQAVIQHLQDLSASATAFFVGNPNATQAQFATWVHDERAFERYPEILSITEVAMVPASRLPGFAERAAHNPSLYLSGQPFTLIPPGPRPFYCLIAYDVNRPGIRQQKLPAGFDVCQTYLGTELLRIRDTGDDIYTPESLAGTSALAVGAPIYASGLEPTTVTQRRAALIGWTGTQILPSTILDTTLAGHAGTAVSIHYQDRSTNATFQAGHRPKGAAMTTVDLHNEWQVRVYTAAIPTGVFGYSNAMALFLGGLLVSLLLGLLIYVLGTGRSSAVQLVHERTDQLQHQALHDSLTGLPNRALILDRIGQMLARGRRQRAPVAALFLDLDNFKDINDTLGHRAGDQLLIEVGKRLASAIRDSDTVGRLGGDEFVVLAEGVSLDAGVQVVADRILDVLATPFDLEGSDVPLTVTASIGIAEGDRVTPEALLQDADIAMYQAKAAGKQRSVRFLPSMQEAVDRSRRLEVDLSGALEIGQFFLMYQPTIELQTGAFSGVEALLRWRHPVRGVVQPNDFIPALESSGLIIPVGAWVLREACRQGAEWHRRGFRFAVSVNISAKQLERDQLVDDVRTALSTGGFDPGSLIMELTETALMHDSVGTVARLQLLKSLGVRLAIDDFGTGYSSLAYLRQFPIDILKIDRSFVSGIADSTESAALVHTLVQLGKVLGLETIAEGVETDDQRTRLEVERVDTGQGFLFARPLEVVDVDRLLGESPILPGWAGLTPAEPLR